MFLLFDYCLYIGYLFVVSFIVYLCVLIYNKYLFKSFNIFLDNSELIISDKYFSNSKIKPNSSSNKNKKKIKKLKNYYRIKSTEKTYEEIKLIFSKPNYINYIKFNIGECQELNLATDVEKHNLDALSKKIALCYLKVKQDFYNIFVNSQTNEYFIKNLNDFMAFYKDTQRQNFPQSNILLKFSNDNYEPLYIFANKNKMTKIVINKEYNNIVGVLEKKNSPFMLVDTTNNYYICFGSLTQCDLDLDDLKKIFFSNVENFASNKNYNLLKKFKCVKIFFYICYKI